MGDASRISAVISKNFNAIELAGLREMMLHRQYDKIDAYEKEWRMKHNIKPWLNIMFHPPLFFISINFIILSMKHHFS